MKLRDKLLISLGFIIPMAVGLINFFSIEKLKDHHIEKYDKYTYAYDCIKEAEITYWDYKCALVNEVQKYIEQIAPSSNLRGYAIVEECEKYDVDICFVLAQGEVESSFGTKGIASKLNCVFNVGIYDNKTTEQIEDKYRFEYPNESIEPYLKLLTTKYLVNKLEHDLMRKFVDINGNRYASDKDYEIKISSKYKFICDNTKIHEYHDMMKSWAIKCNR
ncbi:MAG: glucosaminidase domain-containing protein [Treponema sp.]|nr:glucosaminidase domain-containing protein [Treponema sp.]